MNRVSVERRIRHLQRELVRAAMTPDRSRADRARTLIKAMEIERRNLRQLMNHE